MSVIGKLIISLVVAAIASTLLGMIHGTATSSLILFAAFSAATIATALLTSIKINVPNSGQSSAKAPTPKPARPTSKKPAKKPAKKEAPSANSADREEGEVKWFNVTKGFGFITRDNGEEIFVHFRSIRGEGRRSLRDGQRVSYVVSDSDKGPQAEDVEGL